MTDYSGFPKYDKGDLKKVNAMRTGDTQPDFYGVPILHDEDVLFTRASEMGNKPASCYTCHMQNVNGGDCTCMLIGPSVIVRKVERDGIEYWPCCGMHDYGEPNKGKAMYVASDNPATLGLIWINAPSVGRDYGGANCGGSSGGDDCDHYLTENDDKRACEQGFCRVLQHMVAQGDVCAAWRDDDILDYQQAQQLIQGPEDKRAMQREVREILGKEK